MAFSFGAGVVNPDQKLQRSNPNGLTPDGTVVGRVRRRDERDNSGMMDALIKLFGEMLGRQQPNNTPENLRALRNDPIGDMNKQRDVDVARADNQFMEGFGSSLGPTTRGLGMTPEQVARMQGPTAANQWKFPHLFRLPRVTPDPKPNEWVMPGNLGPNTTVPEPVAPQPQLSTPTPSINFRLPSAMPTLPQAAPGFALGGLDKSFPMEPPTFNFNAGPTPSMPSSQPDSLTQAAERLRKAEAEQAKKASQMDPLARGLRALFR